MPMSSPIVMKVGGAQLAKPSLVEALIEHVLALRERGRRVVLVHGGDDEIAEMHERLAVSYRKELGLRVTSNESLEIVTMVLCGRINTRLVARLNASGQPAIGLSGIDATIMRSELINRARLGRVGGPPRVATDWLRRLIDDGVVVVLSPVCVDPSGEPINVNADVVAQEVAVALDAQRLDFITDVEAVRTRGGRARRLSSSELEALLADSVVHGGMIPKLHAVLAALDGGVRSVRVGSLHSIVGGTATEVGPPPP